MNRTVTKLFATRAVRSRRSDRRAPNLGLVTGLIYVILISLWGVVLVPRWLRHHDESRSRRESARVERALNPHTTDPGAPAAADHEEYLSWREYLRSLTRRDAHRWESAQWLESLRAPRGRHARRRRTIVVSLAAVAAVSLLGAVVGVVPAFLAVAATLLLGGYATAMFLQMRQWEARRPMPAASDVGSAADESYPQRVRDGVRLVPGATPLDNQWEPRETTLPIYASKSKASKIPRRIDLTHQGWTGADMVEQARAQQSPDLAQFDRELAAVDPGTDDQVVEELANYRDRYYRRAVNE